MSNSSRSQPNMPPPKLSLLGGGTYPLLSGNIHAVHPTEFDVSTLPVSGHPKGNTAPLVVQASPEYTPWLSLGLTITWLRDLVGQQVYSWAGGVETAVDSEESGEAHQPSSVGDIHSTPLDGSSYEHGTRIGEAVGCHSSETVTDGAHSVQRFYDIDETTATYLLAKPIKDVMPTGAAKPGETVIGRVIGCVKTGAVHRGGTSEQIFGSPSSLHPHQPYTVYPPSRPSNPNFVAKGEGRTLGQAPSGNAPRVQRG